MKNRSVIVFLAVLFVGCLIFTGNAFSYEIGTSYGWDATTPNYNSAATIHTGTIDTNTLAVGNFLGRGVSITDVNAGYYGTSGAEVSWDDAWRGNVGDANTNGDALDGLWSQIYSDGGWWDLGAGFNQFAVFTSQDHGPYLTEGLEYHVIGSNGGPSSRALWAQATLSDIYLDGWRAHNTDEDINQNGWQSDDISAVFQFSGDQAYRYIYLTSWATSGSLSEPEIDAIAGVNAPVPEPSTFLLLGAGLAGLGIYRRKKR